MCSTEDERLLLFEVTGPPVAWIYTEVEWEYDVDEITDSEAEPDG
jgi:hypothetical protein